jgi:hypothetical protein
MVDVWTDGVDVVFLERGASLYGSTVLETPAFASRHRLGQLGEGALVLGLRGNEVRVDVGKGELLRVVATLPSDVLLDLAAGIVPVEGGPLVELGR